MELNKVTLFGFGRFEEKTSMKFEGKVTAIVGPNEAGKTSFLEALVHWGNTDKFKKNGANPDLSRGLEIDDTDEIISCSFKVTKDDLVDLSDIPEAVGVRSFIEIKLANNSFKREVIPNVVRNKSFRKNLLSSIKKALSRETLEFSHRYEEARLNSEEEVLLDRVTEVLESKEETLSQEEISLIDNAYNIFSQMVIKKGDPKYLKSLASDTIFLNGHESKEHPEAQIIEILRCKCPEFLLFSGRDRNLKSSYALASIDENSDSSFLNLAKLAKLSIPELAQAVSDGETSDTIEILEKANKVLAEEFRTWSQSEVSIELALNIDDKNLLTIMITNPPESRKRLRSLEEGSDGIRQFVALFAFLKAHGSESTKNILLIDEVETHLHYDAQADLIQMLTEQLLSKKVIYTTHSLGCLPEDLGNGIRFIERNTKDDTSKVRNWFWVKDNNSPGFSSILFGMGATSMTFIPMGFTVFTEGAVDHLLLPTLMREAIGKDFLGFHLAPGISNASVDQMRVIDREAVKTVYITDADHGEESLHKQLTEAGISDARINTIFDKESGITIEDIVNKELYVKAINSELTRYNEDLKKEIKNSDIPNEQRSKAVEKWCIKNRIENLPEKRDVAFRLLEMKTDGGNLLDNRYKISISELYDWADAILHPSI